MSFVPNPLFGANQAALQAAMQQDQSLRQGEQGGQGGGTQSLSHLEDMKISKDLKEMQQKVAGSAPPGQAGPSGTPSAFQGPSPQTLQILSSIHNFHVARKAIAQTQLADMSRQMESGWMPNPKQMMKLMKQSGMQADTTPEGIKTAVSYFKQYYGEQDPVSGEQREMPPEVTSMIEKAKTGNLSKQDLQKFVYGGMIKNELRSAKYAELNDMQKAKLEQRQFQMIDRATDENRTPEERASALSAAAILNPQIAQVPKHWLEFAAATPEQRKVQIAIASGMASPKEQEETSRLRADEMFKAGLSREDADAYGRYSSMIDPNTGQHPPMPPELVAKLPKISPEKLQSTTQAMDALINAGVHGDDLANAVSLYQGGGVQAIKDYLPKQTPTQIQQEYQKTMMGLQEQELQIRKGQLGVEQARLGLETYTAHTAGAAQAELRKAEAMKNLGDTIRVLSLIKKPSDREKSLMQNIEDEYAQQLGLRPGVVKKGWLSDTVGYVQAVQDSGGTVDPNSLQQFIGAAQTGKPGGAPASEAQPKDQDPHSMVGPTGGPDIEGLKQLSMRGIGKVPTNPIGGPASPDVSVPERAIGDIVKSIVTKGVVGAFPTSKKLTEEQGGPR